MSKDYTILLLEDEPLILMDLELAGEDRDCTMISTPACGEALAAIEEGHGIDVAILDVSLGGRETCVPVADKLRECGIPFVLHSGDLDRHQERVRTLEAPLIPKPAAAEKVIAAAIALLEEGEAGSVPLVAE